MMLAFPTTAIQQQSYHHSPSRCGHTRLFDAASNKDVVDKIHKIERPMFLYVLQLNDDKYYVGISRNPEERFRAHQEGKGPVWTQLHRPQYICFLKIIDNVASSEEDIVTMQYMKTYGIDHVRGGIWTNPTLLSSDRQTIEKLMASHDNVCYRCYQKGHYAKDCPMKNNYRNHNPNKQRRYDKNDIVSSTQHPPTYPSFLPQHQHPSHRNTDDKQRQEEEEIQQLTSSLSLSSSWSSTPWKQFPNSIEVSPITKRQRQQQQQRSPPPPSTKPQNRMITKTTDIPTRRKVAKTTITKHNDNVGDDDIMTPNTKNSKNNNISNNLSNNSNNSNQDDTRMKCSLYLCGRDGHFEDEMYYLSQYSHRNGHFIDQSYYPNKANNVHRRRTSNHTNRK